MVLFAQRRYNDCIPVLAEAEQLDPADARWPYLRGLALILEQPERGLEALRHAAQLKPSLSNRLRLAEESLKLDQIDEAENLFTTLHDESPENPRVQLGMGMVLARRERWPDAAPYLKLASEHPTARRSGPVALAAVYARLGNTAAAERENQRAADARADVPWPDPILADVERREVALQPRIDRALRMIREGQLDEADELLTDIVQKRPESDEAHLTLAKLHIRRNRMDDAEKQLREAIRLNPGQIEAHFLLGGVHMVRQEYPAAEQCYRRAIELRPAYAAAHFALGECYRKRNMNQAAMSAFRDTIRCRPDHVGAQVELADLLLHDGKTEEAITHLHNALRIDPKSERARLLLKQAQSKQGK
jgi:tetratricopeptide (TPR) repeat protein